MEHYCSPYTVCLVEQAVSPPPSHHKAFKSYELLARSATQHRATYPTSSASSRQFASGHRFTQHDQQTSPARTDNSMNRSSSASLPIFAGRTVFQVTSVTLVTLSLLVSLPVSPGKAQQRYADFVHNVRTWYHPGPFALSDLPRVCQMMPCFRFVTAICRWAGVEGHILYSSASLEGVELAMTAWESHSREGPQLAKPYIMVLCLLLDSVQSYVNLFDALVEFTDRRVRRTVM